MWRQWGEVGWSRWRIGTLVFAAYFALSVLLHLSAWTDGLSSRAQANGGDLAIFIWCLRWAAYAVVHGHNPLFTDWLNYPGGVNMLDNTSCLLLGVLATPITLAFGPVASFNVLQTLAFACSAAAAYVLIRRWTSWRPAAFVGGLVYGFSPYMVSTGWAHLHLTFLPFPPLLALCLDELIIRQKGSAVRWGIALGLLVVAQFFISTEFLANAVELGALAIVVLALLYRREVRPRLRHATTGILAGVAVAAVVLAYPLWFALAGREHGRITAPSSLVPYYSSDLLGPLVPTSNQLVATAHLRSLGDKYSGGAIPFAAGHMRTVTNGSYLGVALVLLVLAGAIAYWRRGRIRLFALVTIAAYVAALGPTLKVAGNITSVPLPDRALYHLPLLEATYPYRYGALMALGAGILLALILEAMRESRRVPRYVPLVAIAGVIVFLIPAAPYQTVKVTTPRYFKTDAVSALPSGSVVLTYPAPTSLTAEPMIWQAIAGLRFRMVGGYIFARGLHGGFDLYPNVSVTEVTLYRMWAGKPISTPRSEIVRSMRHDLQSFRVSSVLVDMSATRAHDAVSLLADILGRAPRYEQGVAAWTRVS